MDEEVQPVAILSNARTAWSRALTMAGQINTDDVYSPVQSPSLVLPGKCVAPGSVNENYVPPAWGDPIDSSYIMNGSSFNRYRRHVCPQKRIAHGVYAMRLRYTAAFGFSVSLLYLGGPFAQQAAGSKA